MTKHIFALNHFTVKICKLIFNDGSYLQFGSSPWTSCAQIQYIVWVQHSTVELLYSISWVPQVTSCTVQSTVPHCTALYRPPRAGAGTMFVNSNVLLPSRARLPSGTGTAAALYLLLSTHSRGRGKTAYLCRHWRAAWGPVSTSSRRWTLLGVSAGEGGCPGRCGGSGDTS